MQYDAALAGTFLASGVNVQYDLTGALDRLAEAGLPPRRFHDLRHGCAALLLASGADLKVVSSILGHSSIRLTADTYAGVVDRLRGDAAEGLERLLNLVEAPTQ